LDYIYLIWSSATLRARDGVIQVGHCVLGCATGMSAKLSGVAKDESLSYRATVFREVIKFLSEIKSHKEVVKDVIPFKIKIDA
jgi:hypothetical protein